MNWVIQTLRSSIGKKMLMAITGLSFCLFLLTHLAGNLTRLKKAQALIQELRAEFWENVTVPGTGGEFNQSLERAGRVVDFLEFAELVVVDALDRQESCRGHFNEDYQTQENEALRDDENFCHVAAWEVAGADKEPVFRKEISITNIARMNREFLKAGFFFAHDMT